MAEAPTDPTEHEKKKPPKAKVFQKLKFKGAGRKKGNMNFEQKDQSSTGNIQLISHSSLIHNELDDSTLISPGLAQNVELRGSEKEYRDVDEMVLPAVPHHNEDQFLNVENAAPETFVDSGSNKISDPKRDVSVADKRTPSPNRRPFNASAPDETVLALPGLPDRKENVGDLQLKVSQLQAVVHDLEVKLDEHRSRHEASQEREQSLNLELQERQAVINEMAHQNEKLCQQLKSLALSGGESVTGTDAFAAEHMEELLALRLETVRKNAELDRLKSVESSFIQTKQVLKDTMWSLRVKEEELISVKADLRENYGRRMNELMELLTERDLKIATLQNKNNWLIESENDHMLRIDELTKKLFLLQEEVDTRSDNEQQLQYQISLLMQERSKMACGRVDEHVPMADDFMVAPYREGSPDVDDVFAVGSESDRPDRGGSDLMDMIVQVVEGARLGEPVNVDGLRQSYTSQMESLQSQADRNYRLARVLRRQLADSEERYLNLNRTFEKEMEEKSKLEEIVEKFESEKEKVREAMDQLMRNSTPVLSSEAGTRSIADEDFVFSETDFPLDSPDVACDVHQLRLQLQGLLKQNREQRDIIAVKEKQVGELEEEFQNRVREHRNEVARGRARINELMHIVEGVTSGDITSVAVAVADAVAAADAAQPAAAAPDVNGLLLKSSATRLVDDSFGSIDSDGAASPRSDDFSEGNASLQRQMAHTIRNYEMQIKKLQHAYDEDLANLDQRNRDLQEQVRSLTAQYDIASVSRNRSVNDMEDLKDNYESKLSDMQRLFTDQIEKERAGAQEKNIFLSRENERMRSLLDQLETQRQSELIRLQSELESRIEEGVKMQLEEIFAKQKGDAESLAAKLEEDLSAIHQEGNAEISSAEDAFHDSAVLKLAELSDSFSGEIFKSHEEQSKLQRRVVQLEDELGTTKRDLKSHVDDLLQQVQKLREENAKLTSELQAKSAQSAQSSDNSSEKVQQLDKDSPSLGEAPLDQNGIAKKITAASLQSEVLLLRSRLIETKSEVEGLHAEKERFSVLREALTRGLRRLKTELEEKSTLSAETLRQKELLEAMLSRAESDKASLLKLNELLNSSLLTKEQELNANQLCLEQLQHAAREASESANFSTSSKYGDYELESQVENLTLEVERLKRENQSLVAKNKRIALLPDFSSVDVMEETVVSPLYSEPLGAPSDKVLSVLSTSATGVDGRLSQEMISELDQLRRKINELELELDERHETEIMLANEVKVLKDKLKDSASVVRARDSLEFEVAQHRESAALNMDELERLRKEIKEIAFARVQLLEENSQLRAAQQQSGDSVTVRNLREDLKKSEGKVKELQARIATSNHVSGNLQEVFANQLVKAQHERDQLAEELDRHKEQFRGYSAALQEKASLQHQLRLQQESLAQTVQLLEAAREDVARGNKQLREAEASLALVRQELTALQIDHANLKNELGISKSEVLAAGQGFAEAKQELERKNASLQMELRLRSEELKDWTTKLERHQLDALEREKRVKADHDAALVQTQQHFESVNKEALAALRNELDADFQQKMKSVEESGLKTYAQAIDTIRKEHQEELSQVIEDAEEKVRSLTASLEAERLRQLGTVKSVMEREHARELLDLQASHDRDMDDMRKDMEEEFQSQLSQLRSQLEDSQKAAASELEATFESASSEKIAALKKEYAALTEAETEAARGQVAQMYEDRIAQIQSEHASALERLRQDMEQQCKRDLEIAVDAVRTQDANELKEVLSRVERDALDKIALAKDELAQEFAERAKATSAQHEESLKNLEDRLNAKHGVDVVDAVADFEKEQKEYFLAQLESLQGEHLEAIRSLTAGHARELDTLKTLHDSHVKDLSREWKSRIEALESDLRESEEMLRLQAEECDHKVAALQSASEMLLQTRLQEAMESHRQDTLDKEALHELEMSQLRMSRISEIEVLRREHDQLLMAKENEHLLKLEKLRSEYEAQALRRELESVDAYALVEERRGKYDELASKLEQLQEQHAFELAQLKELHEEEKDRDLENLRFALRKVYAEEQELVGLEHEESMKTLAEKHREEILALRRDFELKKVQGLAAVSAQMVVQHALELEQLSEENEKELRSLKGELTRKFADDLRETVAEYEARIASLSSDVNELKVLNDGLTQKHSAELAVLLRDRDVLQAIVDELQDEVRSLREKHIRISDKFDLARKDWDLVSLSNSEPERKASDGGSSQGSLETAAEEAVQLALKKSMETLSPASKSQFEFYMLPPSGDNHGDTDQDHSDADVDSSMATPTRTPSHSHRSGRSERTDYIRMFTLETETEEGRFIELYDKAVQVEAGPDSYGKLEVTVSYPQDAAGPDQQVVQGLKQEVDGLKAELQAARENAVAEVAKLKMESARLRQELSTAESEIESLRVQFERVVHEKQADVESLQRQLEGALLKQDGCRVELSALQTSIEQLVSERDAALARVEVVEVRLANELAEAADRHRSEIAELHESHENRVRHVQESHSSELSGLVERATAERLADFEEAKFALMEEQQRLIDRFVAEQEAEIAAIKEEHQIAMEELRQQLIFAVSYPGTPAGPRAVSEGPIMAAELLEQATAPDIRGEADMESLEAKAANTRHAEELANLLQEHEHNLEKIKLDNEAKQWLLLSELQAKFEEQLRDTREAARLELEQEHLLNLHELEQELQEKHELQLQNLAELRQRHLDEVAALKRSHADALKQLQEGHAAAVAKVKESLEKAHEDQIEAINTDAAAELDRVRLELQAAHIEDIALLQAKLKAAQSRALAHESTIAGLESVYEEALEQLQSEHATEVARLKTALEQARTARAQHLDEALALRRLKMESASAEIRAKIYLFRASFQASQASVQGELRNAREFLMTMVRTDIERKLLDVNQRHDAELSELSAKMYKGNIDEIEASRLQMEKQVAELSLQIAELSARLETSESQNEVLLSRHDRYAQETNNLVNLLQKDAKMLSEQRDQVQSKNLRLSESLSAILRSTMDTEQLINQQLDQLIAEHSGQASLTDLHVEPAYLRPDLQLARKSTIHHAREDVDNRNDSNLDVTLASQASGFTDYGDDTLGGHFAPSLYESGSLDDTQRVAEVGPRLQDAVQQLMVMFSATTKQLAENRVLFESIAEKSREADERASAVESENGRLSEQLQEAESRVDDLKSEQEDWAKERAKLLAELADFSAEVEKFRESLEKATSHIRDLEDNEQKLGGELQDARVEVTRLSRECAETVARFRDQGDVIAQLSSRSEELVEENKLLLQAKKENELKLAELRNELEEERYSKEKQQQEVLQKASQNLFALDEDNAKLRAYAVELNNALDELRGEKEDLRKQLLQQSFSDSGLSFKEESAHLREDISKIMDEKDVMAEQLASFEQQVQHLQLALEEAMHEKRLIEGKLAEWQESTRMEVERSEEDLASRLTVLQGSEEALKREREHLRLAQEQLDRSQEKLNRGQKSLEDGMAQLLAEKEALLKGKQDLEAAQVAAAALQLSVQQERSACQVEKQLLDKEWDRLQLGKQELRASEERISALMKVVEASQSSGGVPYLLADNSAGTNPVAEAREETVPVTADEMQAGNQPVVGDGAPKSRSAAADPASEAARKATKIPLATRRKSLSGPAVVQVDNASQTDDEQALLTKYEAMESENRALISTGNELMSSLRVAEDLLLEKNEQISELQDKLSIGRSQLDAVKRQLFNTEAELASVAKEKDGIKESLSTKELEVQEKQEVLAQREVELRRLQEMFGEVRPSGDGMDSAAQLRTIHGLEEENSMLQARLAVVEQALMDRDKELASQRLANSQLRDELRLYDERLHSLRQDLVLKHRQDVNFLKQQHKEEIDRMMEITQAEIPDFEQVRDELMAASRRADERLAGLILQSQQSTDIHAPPSVDPHSVQVLLKELQKEADEVLELVLNYPVLDDDIDPNNLRKLQAAWAEEKRSLLSAIKALKDLVSKTSHALSTGTPSSSIRHRRSDMILAVQEVFDREHEALLAQISTLETVSESELVIANAREQLKQQSAVASDLLRELSARDRAQLIQEIKVLTDIVEQQGARYSAERQRHVFDLDQQVAQTESWRQQCDRLKGENLELRQESSHMQRKLAEVAQRLSGAEEDNEVSETRASESQALVAELNRKLEREHKELLQVNEALESEIRKGDSLSKKLTESESRRHSLEQALQEERKNIRDASLVSHGAVLEMERALSDETSRRVEIERRFTEVTADNENLKGQFAVVKSKLAKLDQDYFSAKEEQAKVLKALGEERTAKQQVEEAMRLMEADKAVCEARLRHEQAASAEDRKKLDELLATVGQMAHVQKECSELRHALDRGKVRIASLEAELLAMRQQRSDAESALVKDLRSKLDKELEENIRLKNAYIILKSQYEEASAKHPAATEAAQQREADICLREQNLEAREAEVETLMSEVEKENEAVRMRRERQDDVERALLKKQTATGEMEKLLEQRRVELERRLAGVPSPAEASSSSDLARKLARAESEKVELRAALSELEDQVMQHRNREEQRGEVRQGEKLRWQKEFSELQNVLANTLKELADAKSKLASLELELGKVHSDSDGADLGDDGKKLLKAGWTIAKVQRLYLKFFRAESFRKALAYQKRYILLLLADYQQSEESVLTMIARMGVPTGRDGRPVLSRGVARFKAVARSVVAISRMKYLVRKYQRNLYKSSPSYPFKEKLPRAQREKQSPSAVNAVDHDIYSKKSDSARTESKEKGGIYLDHEPRTRWSPNLAEPGKSLRDGPIVNGKENAVDSTDSDRLSNEGRRSKERSHELPKRSSPRRQSPRPIVNEEEARAKGGVKDGGVHQDYIPSSGTVRRSPADDFGYLYPAVIHKAREPVTSPPRSYPRALGERRSPPVHDTDKLGQFNASEPRKERTWRNSASSAAPHSADPNASLNNYIRKLEALQARLKEQSDDVALRARPTSLF